MQVQPHIKRKYCSNTISKSIIVYPKPYNDSLQPQKNVYVKNRSKNGLNSKIVYHIQRLLKKLYNIFKDYWKKNQQ